MSPIHAHHDIWHEVLDYFRYDIQYDYAEEVCERRRAILKIALISRSLAAIALDVFWEGMRSLKPVVHVINSFASSREDLFLRYVGEVVDDSGQFSGGHWELQRPINDIVRLRAQEYLGRIRALRITTFDEAEAPLWVALATCLGLDNNSSLLPNLRALRLFWDEASPFHGSDLVPLLSPTLTSLVITEWLSDAMQALALLKLLEGRECGLTRIEYSGYSSPDLLPTLMSFKGLKHLSIKHYQVHRPQRESSISPSDLLKQLTSLNFLAIDLRSFPKGRMTLSSPIHHFDLGELHLRGGPEDLQDFLLNQLTSLSLHTLSLEVCGDQGLSWKNLCERSASSFPFLHSFFLRAKSTWETPPLSIQDLSAILLKPLRELRLDAIPHQLTTDNLIAMLKMLPNLQKLTIVYESSGEGRAEARDQATFDASVLISLSQQPHLNHLDLRLNFNALLTPLSDAMPQSESVLEELCIIEPVNFPRTGEGRLILAKNLLILFPRLRNISYFQFEDGIADLRKIIVALNT